MLGPLIACLALVAAAQETAAPAAPVHGALIGRVTSAGSNTPLARVRVEIVAVPRPMEGSRRTITDDSGRYRFDDLPPGRYTITFSKARYVTTQFGQRPASTSGTPVNLAPGFEQRADIALPRASAIVGRVVDEFGDPVERATVYLARPGFRLGRRAFVATHGALGGTNDAGEYRLSGVAPGDYYVVASERGDGFGADAEADVGFAKTMFPSATNAAEARPVTVREGQDTTGIDIALVPANTALLAGMVTGSDGAPAANVAIQLAAVDDVLGGIGGSTQSQTDGTFSFPRVLPGRYELHARGRVAPPESGELADAAIVPVTIAGTDVPNLAVRMSHGGRIIGKVVSPPGATDTLARASLMTVVTSDTMPFGLGPTGIVEADGTFDWRGLVGPRLIVPGKLPDGWRIASVMRGRDDIIDTPVVFKDPDEVTVVLADDAVSVHGAVNGTDGQPVSAYVAILFAEDSALWTPRSRYVRSATPDSEGGFLFDTMPPARYYVAAVESIAPGEQFAREFLERLRAVATPLDLGPRARQRINLRIVRP